MGSKLGSKSNLTGGSKNGAHYTFQPRATTINVNCGNVTCDFSNGPRYVGTWNGLTVQIRSINGKNVLVTAVTGSPSDKYYPRGDNFWGSFDLGPNAGWLAKLSERR